MGPSWNPLGTHLGPRGASATPRKLLRGPRDGPKRAPGGDITDASSYIRPWGIPGTLLEPSRDPSGASGRFFSVLSPRGPSPPGRRRHRGPPRTNLELSWASLGARRGLRRVFKESLRSPRDRPKRGPRGGPQTEKSSLPPKEAPTRPQEAAKRPQEAPKRPPRRPTRPPRGPKEAPRKPGEAPKRPPRAL